MWKCNASLVSGVLILVGIVTKSLICLGEEYRGGNLKKQPTIWGFRHELCLTAGSLSLFMGILGNNRGGQRILKNAEKPGA